MKFTHASGHRPLDGYTIKRGVGKGGFGEVYFAVSDGGKEVALKLLRGDGDIELRGISHCLNLKHPNLVTLYDLKTDESGCHWVIMEYVSGEPLNAILQRHEKGLPIQLAKKWFLDLCRSVGYLHDHGIVHRDLKPANIFIEDEILKVGDYGLCKLMSTSQRSAQTQSVGTVHYMAPEISTGNYGKQIDVYACGVLLYEMLTGNVPFDGESAGEILMKHLTSTPDLSGLPFEFVPIVSRALAKNPAQRYATMAEVAAAVEALNAPPPLPSTERKKPPPPVLDSLPEVLPVPAMPLRAQVAELSGSMAAAAAVALMTTTFWTAVLRPRNWGWSEDWIWIGLLYFLTVAIAWAVLAATKFMPRKPADSWPRRFSMMGLGAVVGALAVWLEGWAPGFDRGSAAATLGQSEDLFASAANHLSYYALALGLARWWALTDRARKAWFSLLEVLTVALWGAVLLFLWPFGDRPAYGLMALVTAAAIVQWVSPWQPPPTASPRRLKLKYA